MVEIPDVEKKDTSARARWLPPFPRSPERSPASRDDIPEKKYDDPTPERFPWQRPHAHFAPATTATHPLTSMLNTSASIEQSRAAPLASRAQPVGAKPEAAGALSRHRRLLQEPTTTAASPASCPDLASGALKFTVTTWTSLPSEDLVRVCAVDVSTSGGPAAAREMYVSLVVTHTSAEAPVSLKGVTVAFEFSRTVVSDENTGATEVADPSRFVFTCWGAQLMPTAADGSDGGHRAVPCSQLTLDIDAIGPRVTFGDVSLQPGEFLVGGYSNFLFSFKEVTAAPMENAITLLAPFCDVAAVDTDAADIALLAPTFMLGWYGDPWRHTRRRDALL